MHKEEGIYKDAVNKALDFVNAFEKLSEDNQKQLIYEVVSIKGKLELLNELNSNCLRQKLTSGICMLMIGQKQT